MKKMIKNILKKIYAAGALIGSPFYIVPILVLSLFVRKCTKNQDSKGGPRFVWGSTPILNYSYWGKAMAQAGFPSETFTTDFYESINKRDDWDVILSEKYATLPNFLKPYLAFAESLLKYDIFVLSCDGFFLGLTPLWRLEAFLLRFARKKTIVFPYGSDSFVYNRILSQSLLHCLLMSYPDQARHQKKTAKRLDYWVAHADVFIPGFLGVNGFGRWDLIMTSVLQIDLDLWKKSQRRSKADGHSGTVYIAHAPNHRGFKGTEFIVQAVDELKAEGLKVELILIEGLQNSEVRKTFATTVDILVEQLIYTGHGLNAIEGMASGLPVISNLEAENYTLPFRRWSFLDECPIVSSAPETIKKTLRKLIENPSLRQKLGDAGRAYCEKYHSYEAAEYLFTRIIDAIWYDKEVNLLNLYHPLLGEFPNLKPRIEHPLTNNKIDAV